MPDEHLDRRDVAIFLAIRHAQKGLARYLLSDYPPAHLLELLKDTTNTSMCDIHLVYHIHVQVLINMMIVKCDKVKREGCLPSHLPSRFPKQCNPLGAGIFGTRSRHFAWGKMEANERTHPSSSLHCSITSQPGTIGDVRLSVRTWR